MVQQQRFKKRVCVVFLYLCVSLLCFYGIGARVFILCALFTLVSCMLLTVRVGCASNWL